MQYTVIGSFEERRLVELFDHRLFDLAKHKRVIGLILNHVPHAEARNRPYILVSYWVRPDCNVRLGDRLDGMLDVPPTMAQPYEDADFPNLIVHRLEGED